MWRALLLLAVFLGGWAQAKPQVATARGDLYLREGERWVRLTHYGANSEPVVSPDGRWVAYLSTPAWEEEDPTCVPGNVECSGTNLWVIRLSDRQAWRVAGQTQKVSVAATNRSRSAPLWSPDSRQLAWFECQGKCEPQTPARLGLVDMATRQTRWWGLEGSGCSEFDLVGLLSYAFAYDYSSPVWGAGGIAAVCGAEQDDGGSDGGNVLSVIRPGQGNARYPLPSELVGGRGRYFDGPYWRSAQRLELVEVHESKNPSGTLFNPVARWTLDLRTGRWSRTPVK